MSKPFRECPHCGTHLDPGEICDCKDTGEAEPQAIGNPHGPVLVPGA